MTQLNRPILFLATADPARSRAFYECLGFILTADDPFALVFQAGESMLRLQKVAQVHPVPYTALGWAVPDIRQAVRGLHAAGIAFQRYEGMGQDEDGVWTSPAGAQVAWFQDPDGHILSLTQFK